MGLMGLGFDGFLRQTQHRLKRRLLGPEVEASVCEIGLGFGGSKASSIS